MSISRRDLMRSVAGAALVTQAACSASGERATQSAFSKASNSKWTPRKFSKKPNIVIAILDDVGFGDLGCFGSEIDTSNIDKLAQSGVRYNNFHVTALCAPTRACLMTGQNAHKVGVGNIAEWGRPLPGYRGYIREDVKMLPQMLKDSGYNTIAVGKWHMSMVNDQDAMGPFNHWPTGRGFDHWYGFHGSAVDHYHPEVFRNQSQVHPEKKEGYHLTEDLVDQSITYVRDHVTATPDKPFFMYLGFGACHFPFHAPKKYIDKYEGVFEAGYDELRAPRLARQKELGVCPEVTKLTPRAEDTPAWASLPADEKRFSLKTQQAFAGMLDHADKQLGRLVDELKSLGELDDTILIVMSDNGAGGGYHRAGALDVRRIAYIGPESVAEKMNGLEDVGTERSSPLYSTGWSFLGNTPLKRRKGDTYEGGTRTPLIVHWPNGELQGGAICNQYHHVVDVVPFLLELTNSTENTPKDVDGVSFAYTLDKPTAETTKLLQHYETAGDRAIWADGWKAVTLHQKGTSFKDDVWALYHSDTDFSEISDLAKEEPERVKKLIALWKKEAEANNVLPLDDDLDGLYAKVAPKPRKLYRFFPDSTRYNRLGAPDIYRYDFDIQAQVTAGQNSQGCILASGDSAAGYELFLKDGFVHFVYVYTREQIFRMKSFQKLKVGEHKIQLIGKVSGQGGADISMMINGKKTASRNFPKMWKVEALNAGIRCGENKGAPISFDYEGSFLFSGQVKSVEYHLSV
ncbi:MAG: arylsulfatase [Litorimonas sp.]